MSLARTFYDAANAHREWPTTPQNTERQAWKWARTPEVSADIGQGAVRLGKLAHGYYGIERLLELQSCAYAAVHGI